MHQTADAVVAPAANLGGRSMRTLTGLVAVVAIAVAGSAVSGTNPPRYTVTVLEDPPQTATASPSRINDGGQVVGSIFNLATGYFDGAIWNSDGHPAVLSTLYGLDIAEGIGITDDGTVLGGAVIDANIEVPHGAVLEPDATFLLLPSLAGDTGVVSTAFDMNDAGIVVGRSALIATPFWLSVANDAVVWEGGEITTLGTLGGYFATARRINNNRVIIGESNTALSDLPRGFVWDIEAGMQEIPPLGPGEVAQVSDLNDSDVIVGSATLGTATLASFWTDHALPPVLLETRPGDGNSAANGINSAGDIVGGADTAGGPRAMLWMDGQVHDLNDLLVEPLGYPLVGAADITDSGLILARGDDPARPGFVDLVLSPLACAADLDGNGAVGASDLLALIAAWGPCPGCPADLDGDGHVGAGDLLELLAEWGPCD